MTLLHGTSAQNAIQILAQGPAPYLGDNHFYCFNSALPESMVGALCFSTADGFRKGCLSEEKNLFSLYSKLNPNFPSGFKKLIYNGLLKFAAHVWGNDHKKKAKSDLDFLPAIIEFENLPQAKHISRAGVVNEVVIKPELFSQLQIKKIYWDEGILNNPAIQAILNEHPNVEVGNIKDCMAYVKNQLNQTGKKNKLV